MAQFSLSLLFVAAGAIVTVLTFIIRYVWASKSRLKFKEFEMDGDRQWSDSKDEGVNTWSTRFLIHCSNRGRDPGIISDINLIWARVGHQDKSVIRGPELSESVHRLRYEYYDSDRNLSELELQKRSSLGGRPVSGKDSRLYSIVPFIERDSSLGKNMKEHEFIRFCFEITVEDSSRVYHKFVEIDHPTISNPGGELSGSD